MNPLRSLAAILFGIVAVQTVTAQSGGDVYSTNCMICHQAGIAGAPRLGNADDWAPRIARGLDSLYRSALEGTDKGMPPKGGNAALTEAEVKAAVDHMLQAAQAAAPEAQAAPATAPVAPSAPAAPAAAPVARIAPVNRFNRLLKPSLQHNLPPAEDGIHDPENVGTRALQPPLDAFAPLPKAITGNRVDWVQALEGRHIGPRHDLSNPDAELLVMDLNIVRQVKGSMPDVLFPHKRHTEWLDCTNCHVGIFIPQKGANQMSMAAILLGDGCGVCHGKVAFPVSDCAKCHSQSKASPATAAPAGGAGRP